MIDAELQTTPIHHVRVSSCVAWTPFLIDVQLICQNGGFGMNLGGFVGKIESSNTWTLSDFNMCVVLTPPFDCFAVVCLAGLGRNFWDIENNIGHAKVKQASAQH